MFTSEMTFASASAPKLHPQTPRIDENLNRGSVIQVQDLRKIYEKFLAVDGVSFSLEPGTVCGFVGPNGAGKTTTMRCLAGLIPATSGEVRVGGRIVNTMDSEIKRRITYVPDDPPLFDDLSVLDHFHLIARLYQTPNAETRTRDLLKHFDLDHKATAAGSALSRGMRQKLAIGCAALANPDVMLLDEPLTGLDPPGIRHLLDSIRTWAADGKTILVSSHLLAMIQDVCTHVMVMNEGRVRFFGTKEELSLRYPNSATLEDAFFEATQREPDGPATCLAKANLATPSLVTPSLVTPTPLISSHQHA